MRDWKEFKPLQTPPNPSPFFFKKLSNKVIELFSLPLLYSPFFKLPNRPYMTKCFIYFIVKQNSKTNTNPHSQKMPITWVYNFNCTHLGISKKKKKIVLSSENWIGKIESKSILTWRKNGQLILDSLIFWVWSGYSYLTWLDLFFQELREFFFFLVWI